MHDSTASFLSRVDLLRVKLKLLSFQDVPIGSSRLTGSRADAGEQSLLRKLVGHFGINHSVFLSFLDSLQGSLGFAGGLRFGLLGLFA